MLKNRIKILISPILYNMVDFKEYARTKYMQSYNNTEVVKIDENVANTYVYDNFNITMQY